MSYRTVGNLLVLLYLCEMRDLFPRILPGRVTTTSLSVAVGSLKPEVEKPRKRLMLLTGGDVDLAQMELADIEC